MTDVDEKAKRANESSAQFVQRFVNELLPDTTSGKSNFSAKLERRAITLDNPIQIPTAAQLAEQERKRVAGRKRRKTMNAREKKERKLFTIPKDKVTCVLTVP